MQFAVRVAARAKVYHLQPRLARLSQQNVLRLEIPVNDLVSPDQTESDTEGVGKVSDESRTESDKLVLLDQLIEVDGHEFKDDAGMAAEDETVLDVDNIGRVCLIFSQ